MTLKRRGSDEAGPNSRHRFVAPRDGRAGLAVASVQPGLVPTSWLSVADASLREPRCAKAGCGLPHSHPIHEV